MTAAQFNISTATINVVSNAEAQITALKATNKENNGLANSHKIAAYCEIIASIAPIRLVKGNLPRAVSKMLRSALLEEAGLK